MAEQLVESIPPGGTHETDVIIIGAGPCGLFSVFELGLLGIKAHIVDILDRPGGQCAELYPEKPILDIPAIKTITGEELTKKLLEQIKPFGAQFHFNEMAVSLEKTSVGKWRLETDLDTTIEAPVICIAAGGGSFQPKKPPIDGIDAFEDNSIFYAVRQSDKFKDKTLVIAGGGDSAVDWALALQPLVKKLSVIHRRPDFRAAPDNVEKMMTLVDTGKIDLHVADIKHLNGDHGQIESVSVISKTDSEAYDIPCNAMLAFYGLTMKLGPIAEFGINLEANRVAVDTEKFETSVPGIFCIGDMAYYPGKLKLILSGFHEAALMSHGAFHYVFPDKKLKFQHTTSAKDLQAQVTGS